MEILLALGVPALMLALAYHLEIFAGGLAGIWDAFMGVWRTLARLARDGR